MNVNANGIMKNKMCACHEDKNHMFSVKEQKTGPYPFLPVRYLQSSKSSLNFSTVVICLLGNFTNYNTLGPLLSGFPSYKLQL